MQHVDKSKALPLKKSQSLPELSRGPSALKGKGLDEQLATLAPKEPAPTSQAPVSPVVEAPPVAPVAPVQEPAPKVDEKPKVEDKTDEKPKVDEKPKAEEQPKPQEQPKAPSKKELRKQKAEERKQQQIAAGDRIREERAKKPKAKKEDPEQAKEKLKQQNLDKQLWELKVRAQNLIARIDRVEEPLKAGIKGTHKELAEQVVAATAQKTADPSALDLQIKEATQGFESDFNSANYKPRSSVMSDVNYMKTAGLDEALKYSDAALNKAWDTVETAIGREQWMAAKAAVAPLKEAFAAMREHITYFKTLEEKRIPWLTAKLGPTAPTTLGPSLKLINARFKLDAAGLQKLRNKLESTDYGIAERGKTTSEFDAVKNNDTNASAKLDELAGHGVIRSGGLMQKYKSSWDTGDGFSVEYIVEGIPQIVIHSHCDGSGAPKSGANASHWKLKSEKFAPGASHPVSKALLDKFIDPDANRKASLNKKY